MKRSREQLDRIAAAARERYRKRKAARLCTDCAAGLQESDTRLCVECTERRLRTEARYERTHRAQRRAYARKWAKLRRPQQLAYTKRKRWERKVAGLCTVCGVPALDDSVFCQEHRDQHRAHARASWQRKHGAASAAEAK